MYKVRFIVFYDNSPRVFELGLGYLTSAVKKMKDVVVETFHYNIQQITQAAADIKYANVDMVGLPVLQFNIKAVLTFCELIKNKNIHVVLGHREAYVNADYIMKNYDFIDSIIYGEGEETLCELINCICTRKTLQECDGLIYRKGSLIIKNKMRALVENLDTLDFPDRAIRYVKDKPYYVSASRGCLGHCSFCYIEKVQPGKKIRTRSIGNIFNEIENLTLNYNARYICFSDETFCGNFLDPKVWYEDVYNEIIKRDLKIRFNFCIRSEQVNEGVNEILVKMLNVGLDHVFIGIESGNAEDLLLFKKHAKIADNINAIKLLQKSGIILQYGFIMFNPYSTFDKLYENIDFLQKTGLYVTLEDITNKLGMFNGTKIAEKLRIDGLLVNPMGDLITNPYAYKFVDNRIFYALRALEEIERTSEFIRIEGYRSWSVYNNLKYFSSINDMNLLNCFFNVLSDTFTMATNRNIDIFKLILHHAEKGEENITEKIKCQTNNYLNDINNQWKNLKQITSKVRIKLIRLNEDYTI